jgi:hypothetical protein
MNIQIQIDSSGSMKFQWKKYIKTDQTSTAAHPSTSSSRCNVIALSFNHSHLAVFHAANQFIPSHITAKISIHTEFISLGLLNLAIAFFKMKKLPIIKINTVINAHNIENLAYQYVYFSFAFFFDTFSKI